MKNTIRTNGRSDFDKLQNVIPLMKTVVFPVHTEEDYDRAVDTLNRLLDAGGSDENHPLAYLVELVGNQIGLYEQENVPEPTGADPIDILQMLIETNGLKQSDLSGELGSQGIVSEILNRKRSLNTRQIKALSQRFHVSPAVFI